jgi:hypothetical protein
VRFGASGGAIDDVHCGEEDDFVARRRPQLFAATLDGAGFAKHVGTAQGDLV